MFSPDVIFDLMEGIEIAAKITPSLRRMAVAAKRVVLQARL